METFGKFRPTQFDAAGLGTNPENENWLVLPVSRTRDSGALAESNFDAALKMLGGESDNVEVHNFGHWGPGWFEIIAINPDCPEILKIAESIESSLENYPVLDESDFSSREHAELLETLQNCYQLAEVDAQAVQHWLYDNHSISSAEELTSSWVDKAKEALLLTPESMLKHVISELFYEDILKALIDDCRRQREIAQERQNHPAAGQWLRVLADKLEEILPLAA